MSQAVRALNLQPPDPSSYLPNIQSTPRPKKVVQPPKRPQVARPRYREMEPAQSASAEPVIQMPASPTANEQYVNITEKVTGPLELVSPQPASEQEQQNAQTQRTFWRQMRRIFKPSSE